MTKYSSRRLSKIAQKSINSNEQLLWTRVLQIVKYRCTYEESDFWACVDWHNNSTQRQYDAELNNITATIEAWVQYNSMNL